MKKRPGKKGPIDMEALIMLIDETRSLFHRMASAAESLHHEGRLSGGRRGVLMELDRHGPRTVPHMARERPVSRQLIQMIVNELANDGLVESIRNPAHKRSHLISLTEKGRAHVLEMKRKEGALLSRLPLDVAPEDMRAAVRVLSELREAFMDPDWLDNLQLKAGKCRSHLASKGED